MKLLFLDFDGVLNSEAWFRANPAPGLPDFSDDELLRHLDPAAVARLERIVVATGAKVVLSTSWRSFINTDEAKRLLAAKGAPSVVFVGETPRHFREAWNADLRTGQLSNRGAEIFEWLAQRGAERPDWFDYLILDDAHAGELLLPRQILTDFATGLLDEHVERAVRMLTEGA